MPAWDLLPMEKYMPHNWQIMGEENPVDAKGKYAVVSTSIGCPFHCSFCAISALFGGRKVRFWDIDRVVSEIERLVTEFHIKYIKILDECFVLSKEYVNKLCDRLIEKDFDVNMWGYARVDTVDAKLLCKLRKAGIQWLAYGIESADESALAGVLKGQYSNKQTLEAMRQTREAGIHIIANFMFGLPDDTLESMERTLRLCKEINPEWINFYVTMPYPGSQDYFSAVESGKIVEDRWIQYAQYSYECVPSGNRNLSPRQVLEFRDFAFCDFFENNTAYFRLIKDKFGEAAVKRIQTIPRNRLRRKLLEEDVG